MSVIQGSKPASVSGALRNGGAFTNGELPFGTTSGGSFHAADVKHPISAMFGYKLLHSNKAQFPQCFAEPCRTFQKE